MRASAMSLSNCMQHMRLCLATSNKVMAYNPDLHDFVSAMLSNALLVAARLASLCLL